MCLCKFVCCFLADLYRRSTSKSPKRNAKAAKAAAAESAPSAAGLDSLLEATKGLADALELLRSLADTIGGFVVPTFFAVRDDYWVRVLPANRRSLIFLTPLS